jgi:hypothetical protein
LKINCGLSIPPATAIAASTAIAAPTAVTAAASTPAAVAAATASTAGRTRFAWTGLIDSQRSPFDGLAIEFCDSFLRVCLGRHSDERKTARFTGEFILHQGDFLHRASLRKEILKISFRRVEGKISYV